MVAKGRLAVNLPLMVELAEDPVTVLVGVDHGDHYAVLKASRAVWMGADVVAVGLSAVLFHPGVQLAWNVGTFWGLTRPL